MGRRNSAFTLVEIIIVLAIVAILAVIAITSYQGQISKANDARRRSDLDRIKIALEEYEKDHNCYPPSTLLVCNPGTGLQPYLDKIPCDPVTGASYVYEIQDSTCPAWYRVYTKLDNSADTLAMPLCGPAGIAAFNYYVSSPNAPTCVASGGPVGGGITGGGGSSPTPSPSGGAGGPFYGCKGGVCVPILWDPTRPGPECDPNFLNSACYNSCGPVSNECQSWRSP